MSEKRTQFHYVPVSTGEYPGPDVMRQTEDAINDIGKLAIEASDRSLEAMQIVEANQKDSAGALELARQAMETADAASAKADNCESSVNDFGNRLSVAENKVSSAVTNSQNALDRAEEAKAAAEGAVNTANVAKETAEQALTKATTAEQTATRAEQSAAASEKNAQAAKQASEASAEQSQSALEASREALQAALDAESHAASSDKQATAAMETTSEIAKTNYIIRLYYGELEGGESIAESDLHPSDYPKVGDYVIGKNARIFRVQEVQEEDEAEQSTVILGDQYDELVLSPDVVLATNAEAAAGTVANKALTPANLKQFMDRGQIGTVKSLGNNIDLNTLKTNGRYWVNQTGQQNGPSGTGGLVEVYTARESDASANIIQTFISAAGDRTDCYHRIATDGETWKAWSHGLPATETWQGIIELATTDEVKTGTDATRAVTPKSLKDNYLPLTGGTLTGGLEINKTIYADTNLALVNAEIEKGVQSESYKYVTISMFGKGPLSYPDSRLGALSLMSWPQQQRMRLVTYKPEKGSIIESYFETGWSKESGQWVAYCSISSPLTVFGTVTATSHLVSSDSRKKRNITRIGKLDISPLNAYRYNFDNDTSSNVGLMAQEVKEVLPEAVSTDSEGFYLLDYNAVVAVLVEQVKELKAEVESLKTKLKVE